MKNKVLILDCGSLKTPNIEEVVYDYCDFETISFFDLDETRLSDYLGIIISGAPILIMEEDMNPYLLKIDFIKTCKIPVLGICFGHQLIGLKYGAFPSRMKEDRSLNEIESFEFSPLLNRMPGIFEMQEDHCESISLPREFKLIANSDNCINEVMQHESKSIFGVQFHPEVSGNLGHILLENFVDICKKYSDSSN